MNQIKFLFGIVILLVSINVSFSYVFVSEVSLSGKVTNYSANLPLENVEILISIQSAPYGTQLYDSDGNLIDEISVFTNNSGNYNSNTFTLKGTQRGNVNLKIDFSKEGYVDSQEIISLTLGNNKKESINKVLNQTLKIEVEDEKENSLSGSVKVSYNGEEIQSSLQSGVAYFPVSPSYSPTVEYLENSQYYSISKSGISLSSSSQTTVTLIPGKKCSFTVNTFAENGSPLEISENNVEVSSNICKSLSISSNEIICNFDSKELSENLEISVDKNGYRENVASISKNEILNNWENPHIQKNLYLQNNLRVLLKDEKGNPVPGEVEISVPDIYGISRKQIDSNGYVYFPVPDSISSLDVNYISSDINFLNLQTNVNVGDVELTVGRNSTFKLNVFDERGEKVDSFTVSAPSFCNIHKENGEVICNFNSLDLTDTLEIEVSKEGYVASSSQITKEDLLENDFLIERNLTLNHTFIVNVHDIYGNPLNGVVKIFDGNNELMSEQLEDGYAYFALPPLQNSNELKIVYEGEPSFLTKEDTIPANSINSQQTYFEEITLSVRKITLHVQSVFGDEENYLMSCNEAMGIDGNDIYFDVFQYQSAQINITKTGYIKKVIDIDLTSEQSEYEVEIFPTLKIILYKEGTNELVNDGEVTLLGETRKVSNGIVYFAVDPDLNSAPIEVSFGNSRKYFNKKFTIEKNVINSDEQTEIIEYLRVKLSIEVSVTDERNVGLSGYQLYCDGEYSQESTCYADLSVRDIVLVEARKEGYITNSTFVPANAGKIKLILHHTVKLRTIPNNVNLKVVDEGGKTIISTSTGIGVFYLALPSNSNFKFELSSNGYEPYTTNYITVPSDKQLYLEIILSKIEEEKEQKPIYEYENKTEEKIEEKKEEISIFNEIVNLENEVNNKVNEVNTLKMFGFDVSDKIYKLELTKSFIKRAKLSYSSGDNSDALKYKNLANEKLSSLQLPSVKIISKKTIDMPVDILGDKINNILGIEGEKLDLTVRKTITEYMIGDEIYTIVELIVLSPKKCPDCYVADYTSNELVGNVSSTNYGKGSVVFFRTFLEPGVNSLKYIVKGEVEDAQKPIVLENKGFDIVFHLSKLAPEIGFYALIFAPTIVLIVVLMGYFLKIRKIL